MTTPFDRPPPEPWQPLATLDTSEYATDDCPAEQISPITIYQRGSRPCFGWKCTIQGVTAYSQEDHFSESREMAEFEARAVVGYYVQHHQLPDMMEWTTKEGEPPHLDYLGPFRKKDWGFQQQIIIEGGKVRKERKRKGKRQN